MKLKVNIEVAEMVVCRDGFGQLKEITALSTTRFLSHGSTRGCTNLVHGVGWQDGSLV